jgi:prephenate dehydratase
VYVPTLSTASAAAGLAEGAEEHASYDAALCAPIAADLNGLNVLAHDVGDNPSAVTRFVLVSRPGAVPEPTGSDKTTLVAYQTDDHPGGLVEMLEQFAVRGVNLTRLESRPTGDALGQYCFSIDCEGHLAEARVAEALMGLHRTCARVTFLGSYPRAVAPGRVNGSTSPSRRPGTSEADFKAAHAWIAKLRAGGS